MKKVKSVLCAGMAMAVIASAATFAGCMPEEKTSENNEDSKIYAIYTQYAEAAGEDAMTYEEWLESIKGEDGKDGATWLVSNGAPANTLGKDGDLCLDSSSFDLYQRKAGAWSKIGNIAGEDGEGAYEAWKALDPENNTAPKAEWLESLKGQNGENGTKWFYGEGDPAESDKVADAQVGDFYLDTSSGNVYCKGADNWGTPVFKFGAAGSGTVAPEPGKVTIPYKMSAIATVDDELSTGWYSVYIDTGDQQLTNPDKLMVSNYADDATLNSTAGMKPNAPFFKSYFIKAQETENKDKNVYVALLYVLNGMKQFKFEINDNTTAIENATIKFEKVGNKTATEDDFKSGIQFIAPIVYGDGKLTQDASYDMLTEWGFLYNNPKYFTGADTTKYKKLSDFNGFTIKIDSEFEFSESDKTKQLSLLCCKYTSTSYNKIFATEIKSATTILSETDSTNKTLGFNIFFLKVITPRTSDSVDYSCIMPAYITMTAPAA